MKLCDHIILTIVIMPFCLSLSSCGLGHKRLPADSFNYNEAIARSSNEQLLLNLVRMRYREVPVFLSVGSVLSQYFYAGNLGTHVSFGKSSGEAGHEAGANAGMLYGERPTITYSPLTGQEFSQQLLTPIPSGLIFSLVQSGWPPDQLLMMSLERLNHVGNIPFSHEPSAESKEELRTFQHMVQLIVELSKRRVIEMQNGKTENQDTRSFVFDQAQDNDTQNLINELKHILGLDPGISVFRVTNELARRDKDEVTIRIRSLLTLMGFLSRGVEIPVKHIDEGRAEKITFPVEEEIRTLMFPLRVHSQVERPTDAFVAVQHHNHWFYISYSDHMSKQAFGLLSYLFQMQAPKAPTLGPLLTVPTTP